MRSTSRYLRTAVLFTALLAVTAGTVAAQSGRTDRKRRRDHRIFAAQTSPTQVTIAWDEVPGATEYRIYLPNPDGSAPPPLTTPPNISLSGSGRQAIVSGVQRLSGGAYLVAMAGRQVLFQGKIDPVAPAPLARVAAPAAVSAQETGATEVTVTWDAVPGATAYRLGRAVGGEGLRMLCDLCPPEAVFVDTTAVPGVDHLYTVEAIFPLGISGRTPSDPITVGAAQLAAASAPAGAISDKPMASGTPVAVTDANDTNVGASAGTATAGTGTVTTGTGTPPTGTGTVTCPPGTTPVTAMPKTAAPTSSTKPMASGTPVAGTAADNTNVGAASGTASTGTNTTGTSAGGCIPTGTTPTYTPPGQPAGSVPTGTTSTYTPPGQPAGTTSTYTPPGQPASTLPGTSTPVTATTISPATTAEQIATLVQRIGDKLTYLLGGVASGTVHAATPVSSGTMSPVATEQVASWVGSIKTELAELLGNIRAGVSAAGTTTHAATPVSTATTSSTSDNPVIGAALAIRDKVASLLDAVGAGSMIAGTTPSTGESSPVAALLEGIRGDVSELMGAVGAGSPAGFSFSTGTTVHTATPISGSTPTTATPPTGAPTTAPPAPGAGTITACRLDYQRADNMWAAFGRPDGQLGAESISLAPGQNRVFVTDWKYEKQRSDGTNFYGSHLRIATNPTARPIRLQLRSTTLTGLVVFARTGSNTFWIRLDPNASRQFQADLMEVFCEY